MDFNKIVTVLIKIYLVEIATRIYLMKIPLANPNDSFNCDLDGRNESQYPPSIISQLIMYCFYICIFAVFNISRVSRTAGGAYDDPNKADWKNCVNYFLK